MCYWLREDCSSTVRNASPVTPFICVVVVVVGGGGGGVCVCVCVCVLACRCECIMARYFTLLFK